MFPFYAEKMIETLSRYASLQMKSIVNVFFLSEPQSLWCLLQYTNRSTSCISDTFIVKRWHNNKIADWKCLFCFFLYFFHHSDKQPACCQFIIYQTTGLGTSRDVTVSVSIREKTAYAVFFFFQLHTHTHTCSPPLHMLPVESIMTGEFRLICWQGLTTVGHVAQHAWLPASSAAADRS